MKKEDIVMQKGNRCIWKIRDIFNTTAVIERLFSLDGLAFETAMITTIELNQLVSAIPYLKEKENDLTDRLTRIQSILEHYV